MSDKSYRSSLFKRIIDLGVVRQADVDDLVRIWRVGTGDEKAITLANFVATVDADLGSGGSTLTELIEELELNKVPYTGATGNVDLGEFGLSGGYFKFDTPPTSTPTDQGTMYWDEDDNTVDIVLNGYIMKVGEDQFYPVKNQTGSNIPKGTSVRFAGTVGSSGRLLIAPFLADGSLPSTRFMGVTAEAIANGEDGKVLWFGRLRGINTSAFAEGDILYASTTVAGGFQTTVPTAPNNIVEIAAVVTDATNGTIFIRPQILNPVQAGAGLSIDGSGNIQFGKPATEFSDVIKLDLKDYTSVNRFILSTDYEAWFNGDTVNYTNLDFGQISTDLSRQGADGSTSNISIWNDGSTFNFLKLTVFNSLNNYIGIELSEKDTNKLLVVDQIDSKGLENAGDYESNFTARSLVTKQYVDGAVSGATISIGSPANGLSLAGTVLSLGLASSGVTGALSGTDWNTFNGKIGGSGTINRIPRFTSSGILGDSEMFQNGTNIGIGTINADKKLEIRTVSGTESSLRIRQVGLNFWDFKIQSLFSSLTISDSIGDKVTILSGGNFGILTTSPTNTLDVNGTTRIRTISNLGSTATRFLVASATGVISERTGAELLTDAGGIAGTIASGQVAFGTGVNTVGGENNFVWSDDLNRLGIGTGTPLSNLDVRGLISFGNSVTAGRLSSVATRTFQIIDSAAYTRIWRFSDSSAVVNEFIIGTNETISNSANKWWDMYLLTDDSFSIRRRTGNANVDYIKMLSSAFVGVLTTSPTNTLDVNGTTRIRTISNLGSTATRFLVASATGVISERTGAELAADIGAVTITGTQTITGAKTFNNALLIQSGSNPILRLATTDNNSTINFRNVFNEDVATVQMSTPSTELGITTNVSNYNIRIEPHGTGKIKLPNVPTGAGDVLGRDSSNNLVRITGLSTKWVQTTTISGASTTQLLVPDSGSLTFTPSETTTGKKYKIVIHHYVDDPPAGNVNFDVKIGGNSFSSITTITNGNGDSNLFEFILEFNATASEAYMWLNGINDSTAIGGLLIATYNPAINQSIEVIANTATLVQGIIYSKCEILN